MNEYRFVWFLIILATIILIAMIGKMVFGFYADAACFDRGYRWSTVTLTGHIYCELPIHSDQVLKIQ